MFSERICGRHLERSFVVGWRASSSVSEGSVSVSGSARVRRKGGKGGDTNNCARGLRGRRYRGRGRGGGQG